MNHQNSTCSDCGAPATIHLTQIMNNEVKKVHYCESCAEKHGAFGGGMGLIGSAMQAIAAMLTQGAVASSSKVAAMLNKQCPTCGFTAADFAKTHLLGCPDCYSVFTNELGELLKKIQPGAKHTGNTPPAVKPNPSAIRSAISDAREKMKEAVKAERYEDAAKLRDEIKALEADLQKAEDAGSAAGTADSTGAGTGTAAK